MVTWLSKGFDDEGNLSWIMCPICFEGNEIVSARVGGMLSTTEDGSMSDVCVDCNAREYLQMAYRMGA